MTIGLLLGSAIAASLRVLTITTSLTCGRTIRTIASALPVAYNATRSSGRSCSAKLANGPGRALTRGQCDTVPF